MKTKLFFFLQSLQEPSKDPESTETGQLIDMVELPFSCDAYAAGLKDCTYLLVCMHP